MASPSPDHGVINDSADTWCGECGRVFNDGGQVTGEVFTRNADGQMIGIVTYFDGVPSGPQRIWHPNGQRKQEGQCRTGLAVGDWRKWHPNGQLAEHTVFDAKGRRVRRQRWDEYGNLTEDKSYGVDQPCV